MDNFVIYPTNTTCMNANSFVGELCVTRVDCTPTCTDFYLSECAEQWNCNLEPCDKAFFNPYIAGDLIQFQTKFVDDFNPDETNPVDGWGDFITAEVCDMEGNILQTHLDAARSIVGWDGTSSYQILEIDTTGLSGCFSVNFQTFSAPGVPDQTICSEHFKQVECNEPTVVIESSFSSCYDCCGNYYGDPVGFMGDNFNYSNKWRYWGKIIPAGVSVEKTRVSDTKVTDSTLTDLYYLADTGRLFPPYAVNMLYKLHLGAEKFTVDDVEYMLDSANQQGLQGSNMFFINPQLARKCDINFGCEC